MLFRIVLVVLLLIPGSVWAAGSCTINASTGPSFGVYDPVGANATTPMDATGSLSIQCNGATDDLTVAFDQGMYAAGGSSCALPFRQMAQGVNRLRYNLYLDAARGSVWGCAFATSDYRVLPKGASNTLYTIYARIPPGQDVPPGVYADTVGVNVTF